MYKKYDSNDVWLEYDSITGEWLAKPTKYKGRNIKSDSDCYAFVNCTYGMLPLNAPAGLWKVKAEEGFADDDGIYESQPSVVASLV